MNNQSLIKVRMCSHLNIVITLSHFICTNYQAVHFWCMHSFANLPLILDVKRLSLSTAYKMVVPLEAFVNESLAQLKWSLDYQSHQYTTDKGKLTYTFT